jgi:hypothetical protein
MSESFQLPFGSADERVAYSEAWSRSLNERHATWAVGREATTDFRCECWREDCAERIPLSPEEWEMVRAEPNRFAVAPVHVAKKFEVAVKTFP